jgi:uncharacterized membrane protein
MTRWNLLIGLLLLMVVETVAQIGFKFAGNNALPLTLDLPWLERVLTEPWMYVAFGCLAASFGVYMTILKYAPIGPVFAASHLDIVSVALFSIYVLGDRLKPLQALGCCAIVAGVLLLAATETEGRSS